MYTRIYTCMYIISYIYMCVYNITQTSVQYREFISVKVTGGNELLYHENEGKCCHKWSGKQA